MAPRKEVGVRLSSTGGDKVYADLMRIASGGETAFGRLAGASRQSSGALQNVGFQVQDTFVQIAGGTDATRALAQQLPQLLSGFGLFGVLAGTAAAVLIPLAKNLFGTSDALGTVDDRMKTLAASTDAYVAAAKRSQLSVQDLTKEYGFLAEAAGRAADVQARSAAAQAEKDRASAARGIAQSFFGDNGGIESRAAVDASGAALDALIARRDALFRITQGVSDAATRAAREGRDAVEAQVQALDRVRQSLQGVAADYGISAEQAALLAKEVIALGEADGAAARAQAADALSQSFIDVFGSVEAVNAELPGILDQLSEMVDESARAAAATFDLSDAAAAIAGAVDSGTAAFGLMRNAAAGAADAAWDIVTAFGEALRRKGALAITPGGDTRPRRRPDGLEFEVSETGGYNLPDPSKRRGGGGGGRDRAALDLEREAARVIAATRTETEKYTEELGKLNALKAKDLINSETYSRALESLKDDLGGLGDLAKDAAGAIRGAFDNLFDDPAAALKDLAKQLFQMGLFRQLAVGLPDIFGAGGLIPLAGARAGGGPVSAGAAYLVGERGPELFVPRMAGGIVPNGGGGGGTVVQIVNNTGAPVREERGRTPDGRELVRTVIGEDIARGRFDKPMSGRFGAQPVKMVRG